MRIIAILFCFLATNLSAQIDHWETVVQDNDNWKYFTGTSEPASNWPSVTFDDSNWSEGQGGIGYGDGDDNTTIFFTRALYIRKVFTIEDLSVIESVILDVDYDDGFVAYLNGVELTRQNVSGNPPSYMSFADSEHEAQLYQGGLPYRHVFSEDQVSDLLNEGLNILAIQVHNSTTFSSDLSIRPFLSVGINNSSTTYNDPPSWFSEPFEFTTSELPIVVIETNGQNIQDEPPVLSEFGIIYNGPGQINHVTDPKNEYEGFCTIEIRGESSQGFPKKSYGFETCDATGQDVDAAFLNFPEEEDWILYGPYSDKTLMRNHLIMDIGRKMGRYSSRTHYCEVVINGEYKGVYLLMEKIKRDKNRVDIAKLRNIDIEGEELTGGYLFRIDKGNHPGWESEYGAVNNPWTPIRFQYRYPDIDSLQPQQAQYIQSYVDSFEMAIASPPFFQNSVGKHYTDYIDLTSFVDNFIANEISRNIDGYRLSSYFYKDKNSKIVAGPLWDFNLSFGNGNYCNGSSTTGWMYEEYCGNNPFWWQNMLTASSFREELKCRWTELRENVLHTDTLLNFIDSTALMLEQPAQRNFTIWPTLGTYVWPNPSPIPDTYEGEINFIKNWITQRMIWMDAQILPIEVECNPITSTESLTDSESITIFPNPNNGTFNIDLPDIEFKEGQLQIVDITGKIVYEELLSTFESSNSRKEINLEVGAGIYFAQLFSEGRVINRSKIVIWE